jgi:phosphoribosyl-dephospho-CoA transferase
MLAAPLSRENKGALARWTAERRPLVVARRQEGDAPDILRLGLALPGKKRICLSISAYAVLLRQRPPYLLDVKEIGARFWPEAMRELADIVTRTAPDTRVFGSLAWEYFASDPAYAYVTPDSDIDLLLTPAHDAKLATCIELLQNFGSRWPAPRLDGEIALPGGDFVSWREFAARPGKILVKGAGNVSLRPIEDIDALLTARAA